MHCDKKKSISKAISARTGYAKNPDKTRGMELVTAYECLPATVDAEFLFSKRMYSDITGRQVNKDTDVLAYQIRQSFKPGEVTPEQANEIGYHLAMEFTKGRHQFIVATHEDKEHIHSHIIFNSTTLDCDRKFNNYKNSAFEVRKISDRLCNEHGLSVVEDPGRSKHYAEWYAEREGASWKSKLRQTIDRLVPEYSDFPTFLRAMEAEGYEIKRGKYISFRAPGQQRFTRAKTLGENYTEQAIMERLGKKQAVRSPARPPQQVQSLIDIINHAKCQSSKGYERWATVFNLKEAAKTVNYLTEHGIASCDDLARETEKSWGDFNVVSDQIKTVEKRMAEITQLQTHITDYLETKEVYAKYRKGGNRQDFYNTHEAKLLRYTAAVKFFKERRVKELPSLSSLKTEHTGLAHEKQHLLSEYKRLKNRSLELQSIKQNVDRILQPPAGKDRHQEQER